MYKMDNGKTKVSADVDTEALVQLKIELIKRNVKISTFFDTIVRMTAAKPEIIDTITE